MGLTSNFAINNVKKSFKKIKSHYRRKINRDLTSLDENGQLSLTEKGKAVGLKIKDNALEDNISIKQTLHSLLLNDDGSKSTLKIAGASAVGLMGVGAGGRILSGGGLYRDSDGNFDVIGVPFI